MRRRTNGRILRAKARGRVGLAGGDRARVALLEVAHAAEQARVGEVHHAPQLLEPVLDRRAAEHDAKLPLQPERRARRLAAEVLDRLRFVEDDDVPRPPAARRSASRRSTAYVVERDVGRRVELRASGRGRCAVRRPGRKRAISVGPVVDDALRAHDERAPAQDADRLERLAEPHVVGEHGAELRVAQEREPVDARPAGSAGATRSSPSGSGARGMPANPSKSGARRVELRRPRRFERVAERPEAQQRRDAELLVGVARGEEVGDEVAVPREPVRREAAPSRPLRAGTRSSPSRHARTTAAASARFGGSRRRPRRRRPARVSKTTSYASPSTLEPRHERRAPRTPWRAPSPPLRFCQSRSFVAKRMASVPSRSTRRPGTRFSSSRRRRSASRSSSRRRVGARLPRGHDRVAVDARDGRIAVHQRRQDRERVPLVREIELDPRARLLRPGAGASSSRSTSSSFVSSSGRTVVTRSIASFGCERALERQPLEQLAGGRGLADRVEHVAAPDDPLGDDRTMTAASRSMRRRNRRPRGVLDARVRQDRLARRRELGARQRSPRRRRRTPRRDREPAPAARPRAAGAPRMRSTRTSSCVGRPAARACARGRRST